MDKYTATEQAYKHGYEKGYAKGFEDGKNEHAKRAFWVADATTGIYYCSECLVSGSPNWKRCPVCESIMERKEDGEKRTG